MMEVAISYYTKDKHGATTVDVQAPVVRRMGNAIRWINHYPADSMVCFVNTYHWIVIYSVDCVIHLSNN